MMLDSRHTLIALVAAVMVVNCTKIRMASSTHTHTHTHTQIHTHTHTHTHIRYKRSTAMVSENYRTLMALVAAVMVG
jgi:hypothetical protein